MRYGIGFKLALLLAAFGLVAMGLVGYYSYERSRATLVSATQNNLLTATQVLSRSFEASIQSVSRDAILLARLPVARHSLGPGRDAALAAEQAHLADAFKAMMAVEPEYFQIRLINANQFGREQVRVDRDGDLLTQAPREHLQEKAHFPYVFDTMQLRAGQINLSPITLNNELGNEPGSVAGLRQPTVWVATPVVADSGTVVGVIVINLDLNRVFDRLRADLPTGFQVYLSNRWGDVLIHPQASETFGFESGRRVFIQDTFEPVAALISGERSTVVAQKGPAIQGRGSLIAAFVRRPFGELSNQRFVVFGLSRPLDEVVREADQLGWNMIRLMFAVAALALALAFLVARVVTEPLKTMVKAMRQFSQEQVIRPLPSARGDEIGALAHSLNEMQATIVNTLRELNESRQSLRHLAQHDPLTGLPNRALFNDRLVQALAQARRSDVRVALLFVDLDGFKAINDHHGHHMGDLLLIDVARRMSACVRQSDTVGRLGGDEFVVLLSPVDQLGDARLVAETICRQLDLPFVLEGQSVRVAASVGLAVYPEHGADADHLSRRADAAMYLAKSRGGGQVLMADEPPAS